MTELKRLDVLQDNYMAELITPWEHVSTQFSEERLGAEHTLFCNRDHDAESNHQSLGCKPGYMGLHDHAKAPKRVFPRLDYEKNPMNLDTFKIDSAVKRGHPKLWETVQDLRRCAELVTPLLGFDLRVKSLNQRAARLEDNLFSVALFGAFSAGKSSLANALLGDSVLPVSPNPTTATINKILPPTDRYPHGTTKVKLKSLPDLTTDVLSSLAVLKLTAIDLTQALLLISGLDSQDVRLEAKPHLSFLRAVARDQASLLDHLGEELTVEFQDFRDFVVSEDKACFVEGIELYFSCPLTELDNNALAKVPDLYKNPKDWAEGQGRVKMQETVIKIVQPNIKDWLNECSGAYKELWQDTFEQECKTLTAQTYLEVAGYYSRLATALGDGYDLNYLEHVRGELASH